MNKPKFTPKPWCVHRSEIHHKGIDLVSSAIFSDNSPIGIIASMPHQNEFLLLKEYKDRFSQDEVDANAVLMSASPDMYEELEKTASFLRFVAKWIEGQHGVIAIGESLKYKAKIIDKLLAKARGEVENGK